VCVCVISCKCVLARKVVGLLCLPCGGVRLGVGGGARCGALDALRIERGRIV
jgi:hypothetical protein